ncbi:MAG: 2-hydroxychromene-2-carboxylate isomerase [Hellea sp.]
MVTLKDNKTSLDFYYDFGSPNVYFAWKALEGVSERTGLKVIMHPVLIGGIFKLTNNQPPWQAFGNVPNKMKYMQLEIQRFVKDHGLTDFKFNSAFPVNTLLAMRAAIAAQNAGRHNDFYPAVFKAMWEEDKDISQPDVLSAVLEAAGLDGAALVAAAQTPEVKQGLMEATQACVDRGAFGLPTFFLGDEIYFGKDRIWQIEQTVNRLA